MLTARVVPKSDFETGPPWRREEFNVVQRAKFQTPITFKGVATTTTTINLKFPFIKLTATTFWGEFGCKGCVSCGWAQ